MARFEDDARWEKDGSYVGGAEFVFRDADGWWPSSNVLFTRRWPACFRPSFKMVWQCLVCNASGPWSPTKRKPRSEPFVIEALAYDDIKEQTGWNRSTVRRAEGYLRSVHLIERLATGHMRPGQPMTNVYRVQPDLRRARWELAVEPRTGASCGWREGRCDHSMLPPSGDRVHGDHHLVVMKNTISPASGS